jgi:hypothetical protein
VRFRLLNDAVCDVRCVQSTAGVRAETSGAWGPMRQGSERKTPMHGAAWGRMGPHGAAHGAAPGRMGLGLGPVQKITRGGGGGGGERRAAGCYLLRWRWTNNPLALPSNYPIPDDLFITDPTCLIAGRDGAPLGERHEALARRWRAKGE